MLVKTLSSPVALYDALLEAKVSRETATKAAEALSTDVNNLLAGLATKQDITMLRQDIDSLKSATQQEFALVRKDIETLEVKINSRFNVVNLYLIVIGILSASSSPLFSGLVHSLAGLLK